MRKSNDLFILLVFFIFFQSCIIFNFVGQGIKEIESYQMPVNISQFGTTMDNYVEENSSIIRRTFDGTGYDRGYYGRLYYFLIDSFEVDLKFYGDTLFGYGDNKNLCLVDIIRIRKGENRFLGNDKKRNKNEREILNSCISKIEESLITPVRERLKKQ